MSIYSSGPFEIGRCESLDLAHLLTVQERRWQGERRARSVANENRVLQYLNSEGFPLGLAQAVMRSIDSFAVRIWIIHNSGSMNFPDGHRAIVSNAARKIEHVACTRWEEASSTCTWHGGLCLLMEAPMVVRLVSDPGKLAGKQQVTLASTISDFDEDLAEQEQLHLRELFRSHPVGNMSLALHLKDILQSLRQLDTQTRLISLVLIVDRLPTDAEGVEGDDVTNEFLKLLVELQRYPVRIEIRMSTDDQRVLNFYCHLQESLKQLDNRLSDPRAFQLFVVDDYFNEAVKVYYHNPWLNYGYPLHLCRETCIAFPVFDALSDHPLLPSEMADFVTHFFGLRYKSVVNIALPDPSTHYDSFRTMLVSYMTSNLVTWNPITRGTRSWIDLGRLDAIYSYGNGAIAKDATCFCAVL